MGKQNNTVKFVVPVFRCSGVFRCFGVFQCSGVLVHAVHSGCVTRKRSSRIPVFLCNRHTGVIEHSRHPLLVDVKGGGGGGGKDGRPKQGARKMLFPTFSVITFCKNLTSDMTYILTGFF